MGGNGKACAGVLSEARTGVAVSLRKAAIPLETDAAASGVYDKSRIPCEPKYKITKTLREKENRKTVKIEKLRGDGEANGL